MTRLMTLTSPLLLAISTVIVSIPSFGSNPATLAAVSATKSRSGANTGQVALNAFTNSSAEDSSGGRKYKMISIDIPGAAYVFPLEINNHRIVSGIYADSHGIYHSFLWFDGQVETIDNSQAEFTVLSALNDNGRFFGNWGTDAIQHAGYYELTTNTWVQMPDIPGYPQNIGNRMNDLGHAVGYACQGTFSVPGHCTAWSWDGSNYTLYDYPGALNTLPYGINNKGKEVGTRDYGAATFNYRGYSREQGRLAEITLFTRQGTFYPSAEDINDNGDILADAPLDPTGYWPSFILRNSHSIIHLPNYPGVLRTFYQGMNEHEDLVGAWFNNPAGPYYGFIALREDTEADD